MFSEASNYAQHCAHNYAIAFPQTPTQPFVLWKFMAGNEATVLIYKVM